MINGDPGSSFTRVDTVVRSQHTLPSVRLSRYSLCSVDHSIPPATYVALTADLTCSSRFATAAAIEKHYTKKAVPLRVPDRRPGMHQSDSATYEFGNSQR